MTSCSVPYVIHRNQRFATIDSFNTQEAVEDSDDEEGQAFYAGGSETR